MDKIIINSLRVYAYHGVNEDEKEKGQPFDLDITCYLDLSKPCESDCVDDTVSYAQIIKLVKREMVAEKFDLLERAAQHIADCILTQYNKITKVDILIKKPRAPILADFGYVAVEISRKRV